VAEPLSADDVPPRAEPAPVLEQVLREERESLGIEAPEFVSPTSDARRPTPPPLRATVNPLLDQLVGREIATRLRARYAEVAARIDALDQSEARSAWLARADALDPDRWASAEAILVGIQNADRLFDELKRELPAS
jgi:hypothetical protein